MPLAIGQWLLNRYRIDALLGQGGMGAVYRAYDRNLDMVVAVKENGDISPAAQKQFGLEASLLARLFHPNLPRVTDHFFIADQGQYLVMDYIEGEALDAMLDRLGAIPEAYAVAWITQVCDALAYLHQQTPPIIHRDIKPANIKIRPDGQAMLVDFGIAKIYDPHLATTMAAKAVTPGYSPPEQYGGGVTDARSDIYALGATLYTLLTGQTLPESVQRMVSSGNTAPPRQFNPQISPHVEGAILTAIEVAADRRFQRAEAFRTALMPPPSQPLPIGPAQPDRTTAPRRQPLLIGGAVLIVLALIIGGVLSAQPSAATPTSPPRSPAAQITKAPIVTPTLPTPTLPPTNTPPPIVAADHLIAYESGPDGAWQIFLANPATDDVWLLPGQPRNSGVPSWLPDGRHVAFRSNADGSWQIYTINIDGTDLRQLTAGNGNNYEPNYSLDGKRIAFVSDRDGDKEIYVMDSDGRNQQRLTNSSGIDDDPNWSPDGQWIVFESRRDARMDVYKMRADGSELTRLTSDGKSNSTPAWSPDGQSIAFERDGGDATHIWIMDVNGGTPRQITFDGTWNVRPAWSANGFEIAYNSDRENAEAVWIVPIDNSRAPMRVSSGQGYDPAWSRR